MSPAGYLRMVESVGKLANKVEPFSNPKDEDEKSAGRKGWLTNNDCTANRRL